MCHTRRKSIKSSRIYKTNNGGSTWEKLIDIEDEIINNIYFTNNNIWVVGNYGLIIKSNDYGKTWIWYDKKLNEYIWSLAIVNNNFYIAGGWQSQGVMKSDINSEQFELDLGSEGTTVFQLTSNGEYLFTEISDGKIGGRHEILRKRIIP